MQTIAKNYFETFCSLAGQIQATDASGAALDLHAGIGLAAGRIEERRAAGAKLMFVGNGASAAISSHMSTDYWKNGGIRAVAFNDPALLTCMGNDYGYPDVFEKPVEMFADPGDLLVAISSSGQSENILKAAAMARTREAGVITLSGFKPDNPLRALGDVDFYVPHAEYGPVEILHHAVCHCILDTILEFRRSAGENNG